MAREIYWIWFQRAIGVGNIKSDQVLERLGTPERLYRMTREELEETGLFAPNQVSRIRATPLEWAEEELKKAEKHGCAVITPEHPDYPQGFRNIACKPCVLYVRGDLSGLEEELILTMVGTREKTSTEYGLQAAFQISRDLAAMGCTVVSGLAVGIDAASHEGALAAGGRTIGMLACGQDIDYPLANHDLKARILKHGGALVSEFPFGEQAHRGNFSIRNRLMSGIAAGVVVVQAPAHSGALITANHANEQGRDVFAVPGGIFDSSMVGCNLLIREGAKIVINPSSILEEYVGRLPEKMDPRRLVSSLRRMVAEIPSRPQNKPLKVPRPAELEPAAPAVKLDGAALEALGVSAPARRAYAALDRVPAYCDELAAKAGLSTAELMSALTELELKDLAECLPGKRYVAREGTAT